MRVSISALIVILISTNLGGAEVLQDKSRPDANPVQHSENSDKLDPTQAIVAQGHEIYRQRDVDALVLVANRHLKSKLSPLEEDQLRQSIGRILVTRESLLDALASLPPSLSSGKGHDAFLLDVLDYQSDTKLIENSHTLNRPNKGESMRNPDSQVSTDSSKIGIDPSGPVIVSLPPLSQTRTIEKLGHRQLSMQIALVFPDASCAKRFEEKAPLIRDAILGYVHQLPPQDFTEPDQSKIKVGIQSAVSSKIPDFPKDAILIPQLECSNSEPKEDK